MGIFGFIVVYNGYFLVFVCSIKYINVWGMLEIGIILLICLLIELSFWFCCLFEIFLKVIWWLDSGLVL